MDSKFRIKIFSVLFFSIFTAMMGLGIIIPILPLYARTVGANGFWIGAIFAGFSLSRSVFMPIIGKFSDKKGRKKFITTGLFIYALSSMGYIIASSAPALFLIRIVQGFCSAMIVPIAMAYIGDIAPQNKEGSYMGLFTVSLFLGFGFGPLIGGFVQDFFSIDLAFILMGILCSVAFIFVLIYLPASHPEQQRKGAKPPSFADMLKSPRIKGVVCYRFVNSFSRASALSFLPLYASYNLNLSVFEIGLAISTGILLMSFLQIPCGHLADTMDKRTLILVGGIFYSAVIFLVPCARSFTQVLIINLFLGIMGAIPLPAATALIVKEGKKYGMGSTMAIFNVAMSLGLATGPLLSGLIYDSIGLAPVFYFSALFGVLGTTMSWRFLSSPSQQELN